MPSAEAEQSTAQTFRIHVRPSTPADSETMKALWRTAFGDSVFGGDRHWDAVFEWAYERNPDCERGSVCHWVAELDGRIGGTWSSMPVRLRVRGKLLPACWTQNAAIAPQDRRSGIGRKVVQKLVATYTPFMGVGLVPASRALAVSEGMQFVSADRVGLPRLRRRSFGRELLHTVHR